MLRQATSCRSMSWCQRWNDSSCGHGECTIAARWISGGFKWCFMAGIVPYVSSLEWQLYMEVTDATAGWVQLSGKAAGRVGTVPPSLFGTAFWSGFLTSRPGLGFLFPVSVHLIFASHGCFVENVVNGTISLLWHEGIQSICRRHHYCIWEAPQKTSREEGEGERGTEKGSGKDRRTQKRVQREQDRKRMRSLEKEREGWKHSRDKEHSCRESWGLFSGLGIDLSCSLWEVMSRFCLQCVLRSLECELSCLLLDSLFTKQGGPVLIFYSDSFCNTWGWTS